MRIQTAERRDCGLAQSRARIILRHWLLFVVLGFFSGGRAHGQAKCDARPGANAGVKLAACLAALSPNGGIADATGFLGAHTVNQDIFSGVTWPVTLLLGSATFNASVPQNPSANVRIIGAGRGVTIWKQTVNVTTGGGNTAGDGFRVGGDNFYVGHLTLRGAAGTNPPQSNPCCGGAHGVIWTTGNNAIFEDLIVERWAERAFQIGAVVTGVRINNVLMQDIGDEPILVSTHSGTSDVIVSNCEITRYRSWAIDFNAPNGVVENCYVHDSNNPTTGGLADAGGINISTSSFGGNITGGTIKNNRITNLFPGVQGYIHLAAWDGTTLQGIVVQGNQCRSDINADQICTYYEPAGSLLNGVLQGIVTDGNFGFNARFYSKVIKNASWTANTTISTLSDASAGIRIDSTLSGIVLGNNLSIGWQIGAQMACTHCVVAPNYFSGRTVDFSNNNTAPYISWNILPTFGGNGALSFPEISRNPGAASGQETLWGDSSVHRARISVDGGTITTPVLTSDQVNAHAIGGAYQPQIIQYAANSPVDSATVPTISSGFGASPSIVSGAGGTSSFQVNVGTGGTANSGVLGMPKAANGWTCTCQDKTTFSTTIFACHQTADTPNTVTIGNFNTSAAGAAWASGDVLYVQCRGR